MGVECLCGFFTRPNRVKLRRKTNRSSYVAFVGVLAEMEKSLITELTLAGVRAAQLPGVKFGRWPKLTGQQIAHVRKLIDQGEAVSKVAKLLGIDRATVYWALQRAA